MKLKKENAESELTQEEQELLHSYKMRKKKWIISGVVISAIILLAVAIYFLISSKNAEGQVKEFDKAIRQNDYQKLSEIIDSGDHNITKEDAKRFVTYVKNPENHSRYQKEIKQVKDKLKGQQNEAVDLGKITDKNGTSIVDITRNGSKMLFLDDLAFTPNFHTVYVNEGHNTASYEYQYNGKAQKKVGLADQKNELGKFFVGNYKIPATKTFKDTQINGSVDGQLHINTDKVGKNNKIIAEDLFPQAYFKVKIENEDMFKDSLNLYFDGEKVEYNSKKAYGKYPADVPIEVSAIGKVNNDTLETQAVQVEANKTNKPQTVKLSFDSEEIQKQKEENKKVERKAKKFMEDYTKKLNTGYKVYDFNALQYYFEDKNSDVAQNIKKQVEAKKKHKYSKPEFKSYERDDTQVKIVLSKKDENQNVITSQYVLKYDYKEDDFKIKDYTDV